MFIHECRVYPPDLLGVFWVVSALIKFQTHKKASVFNRTQGILILPRSLAMHAMRRGLMELYQPLAAHASLARSYRPISRHLSADARSTFSTVWQDFDNNRHKGELVTPDPMEYLRGFDSCECVQPYKRAMVSACSLAPGHSVLDVGCGLASQAVPFCEAVGTKGNVTGIDSSTQAISEARKFVRSKNL
jgi:hypothetical protein